MKKATSHVRLYYTTREFRLKRRKGSKCEDGTHHAVMVAPQVVSASV